jgi:hypothetical protein
MFLLIAHPHDAHPAYSLSSCVKRRNIGVDGKLIYEGKKGNWNWIPKEEEDIKRKIRVPS